MPRSSISPKVRWQVFARDNYTCRYCGRRPPEVVLVVDHHIPVAQGGTDDIGNLVTSCELCNQGKSDLHPARPLDAAPRHAPMSWAALVARDPDLALMEQHILESLVPDAEDDPTFCANRHWYGEWHDGMGFGMRDWIYAMVGPNSFATDPLVKQGAAIGVVMRYLWELMPDCRHDGVCRH
jgi:hypothetical protein